MTERPRSSLAVWLIVAAVLLPVVYVLSIGPAMQLDGGGILSDRFIWTYWPLLWLHAHCPPARNVLDWYVGLWVG